MTTWRLPQASVSKTRPNGIQPSIAPDAPIAGVSASSRASPSVSRMSGEKVSRASRAPIDTMFAIGLTMISPASRNSSAHATAHTSARVTDITSLPPSPTGFLELADGRLVVGLAAGQVGLHELLPRLVGRRGLGVVPLELLVAAVVRLGRGEVGAVGGLDDGVHHHPVDQQRLRRHRLDQFLGGHHPFDGQVSLLRGHQEQVVEVRVDAGVGRIALGVTEIQVDEGGIEVSARASR